MIENDIELRSKYVSAGKCGCQTHDTYFMIEIADSILAVDIIHDIEEVEESCKDVKLFDILARHENRKTFLQLIVIQKQHQQSLSIENP